MKPDLPPRGVPWRVCPVCREFLPHACAPVITITRLGFGSRTITIADRP